MAIDLSIIIVNWNTRDMLKACLTSVVASFHALEHPEIEIFVLDNASTDGSSALVRERFPGVCLIQNDQNLGFACANNQAMKQSHGRYLLILNSDTEVRPGALTILDAFMDAHPKAGAAGARLLNPDGTLQVSCYPMLTPGREFWRLLFLDTIWPRAAYPLSRWSTIEPQQVDVIMGACLCLRRSALEEVGLLDESYFMYTEEVDLCYRLARAGWEAWWVPKAHVVHHGQASSKQAAQAMYIQLYRSKVQFYRKFGGDGNANHFKRMLRLAYWPRLIVARAGGLFSPQLAASADTYRRLLTELPAF